MFLRFVSFPLQCVSSLRLVQILFVAGSLSFGFFGVTESHTAVVAAQTSGREINVPTKAEIIVRNRLGRVSVTSSAEHKDVSLRAESSGKPVGRSDVVVVTEDDLVVIEARERAEADRIDLNLEVPERAKVRIVTEAGAVDVVGNFREATVETNTGTVRADVPIEALNFSFVWTASRPRVFSGVDLPEAKERAGGRYEIAGRLGERDAPETERTRLRVQTERGVVLLGVKPEMVPGDLRERQLTEAARAIVRSGDEELTEQIRRVAPRLFDDYAKTLPPRERAPRLATAEGGGGRRTTTTTTAGRASLDGTQLMQLNATVTDREGRAVKGLTEANFKIYESGTERRVVSVTPSEVGFNLVLLLDTSGSVESRLAFIKEAARGFINAVNRQDRVAIISFREDVQPISPFTTNRSALIDRLERIQAGGPTALYDALCYTLLETLRLLRNERTAIVVLSDGDDNKSFLAFPSVLDTVTESGAIIYPLYVPSGLIPQSRSPEASLDPTRSRYLALTTRAEEEGQQLASASGGRYYSIKRLTDLPRAYEDIVAQLRAAYTITYESVAPGASAATTTAAAAARPRVRINRDDATVRTSPAVSAASR